MTENLLITCEFRIPSLTSVAILTQPATIATHPSYHPLFTHWNRANSSHYHYLPTTTTEKWQLLTVSRDQLLQILSSSPWAHFRRPSRRSLPTCHLGRCEVPVGSRVPTQVTSTEVSHQWRKATVCRLTPCQWSSPPSPRGCRGGAPRHGACPARARESCPIRERSRLFVVE